MYITFTFPYHQVHFHNNRTPHTTQCIVQHDIEGKRKMNVNSGRGTRGAPTRDDVSMGEKENNKTDTTACTESGTSDPNTPGKSST